MDDIWPTRFGTTALLIMIIVAQAASKYIARQLVALGPTEYQRRQTNKDTFTLSINEALTAAMGSTYIASCVS